MTSGLTWDDAEEIATALRERMPELDPLTIRFTDLRDWVVALPEFADDPAGCTEGRLEAIQMAWFEQCREA